MLLTGSRQLEEGEEFKRVPVHVIIGVQLRLLPGRRKAGAVWEPQVIIHLCRRSTEIERHTLVDWIGCALLIPDGKFFVINATLTASKHLHYITKLS